ncbi:uncharacterized protein MONBRDRAFT_28163 [Monosiga brevicollis MX1]|uniref:Selenoprotein H n=1 Tax=Monosiga brevicollis TaxID=81824 RepID=A9V7D7_MONBE|nr:uncharacterized protein MONBRDRAFT_28163 [Monosiga brevicollis MX1]EDQ86497.1 predicted protein [Monosiga brevicollis MX1]|eukprot:XP_001748610.1 hypothetical protein [Monosiga brevicollis MX1]
MAPRKGAKRTAATAATTKAKTAKSTKATATKGAKGARTTVDPEALNKAKQDVQGVFKRSAAKLETLVKDQHPDAQIVFNSEKPRRGCFEVTVNGNVVVSLLEMPRPFKKLREYDLDKAAEEIAAKLKARCSFPLQLGARSPLRSTVGASGLWSDKPVLVPLS